MSGLADLDEQVDAYLGIREAVGLTNKTLYRRLHDFVAYARSVDESPIRAATAIAWAWDNAAPSCGVRGRSDRLMVARGFLRYLATIVPGTEIPSERLIATPRRRRPYIFSDEEVAILIGLAGRPSRWSQFRPIVLSTLLGVLATTGLRIREAVRLCLKDVHLQDDHPHLQILQTKFQKSRLVPVHHTVAAALRQYLERRRQHAADAWSDRLFVNIHGGELDVHILGRWFAQLTRENGMTPSRPQDRAPTLTSFRHTFAVRRLREWHLAGLDVQSLLPTLATYLGHVGPESTYWYLSATPELLRAAGTRFNPEASFRREP